MQLFIISLIVTCIQTGMCKERVILMGALQDVNMLKNGCH